MKGQSIRRMLGLIIAAFLLFTSRAGAQSFVLLGDASPNPVVISNTLTYTIEVDNLSAGSTTNVLVTSVLPSSVQFVSASSGQGTVTNNSGTVSLLVPSLGTGEGAILTILVTPTALGNIDNTVSLFTNSTVFLGQTIVSAEVISAEADLGVSITQPQAGALVNDWIVFDLSVTNAGPDDVPSVWLTNKLVGTADGYYIGLYPTNLLVATNVQDLVIYLETVAAGKTTNVQVQIQPTNSGPLTWITGVTAAGLLDTNAVNDIATNNYTVVTNQPGNLVVTNLTAMALDYQTTLLKQTVRLQNTGTVDVVSARVVITDMTNWLYNAVGTNDGNPFVVYRAPLTNNQFVDLVLEYTVRNRTPFVVSNSQYTTVAVLSNNITVPTNATLIGLTNSAVAVLTNGNVLVQFLGVSNRTYTIEYSDYDSTFTNPVVIQPAVRATSRTIQWVDDGPPKAISFPPSSRYYRVYLNP